MRKTFDGLYNLAVCAFGIHNTAARGNPVNNNRTRAAGSLRTAILYGQQV